MHVPVIVEELAGLPRSTEPLSVGIPLEKGLVHDVERLTLYDEQGAPMLSQLTPLTRWSDSTIRWALLDALVTIEPRGRRELELRDADTKDSSVFRSGSTLDINAAPDEVTIDTGLVKASIPRAGALLLSRLHTSSGPVIHEEKGLNLILTDDRWMRHSIELTSVDVTSTGPLRCSVTTRGRLGPHLIAVVRMSLWSGLGLIRIDLTLRNPRAAKHKGGTWDLGDPGSVFLRDISLSTRLAADGHHAAIGWTDRVDRPLRDEGGGFFEIYQGSSGGERWNFKTHLNRDLRVPHAFRGYRVRRRSPSEYGDRASPTVWLSTSKVDLGASIVGFWQNFPKAIETRNGAMFIRLWPQQFRDLHELQGGEQKTHTVWLSAEGPANLGFAQEPLVARCSPSHYAKSGVFPHLVERDSDENEALLELTDEAINENHGFVARREAIDEYGWRNFGDLFADHENVGNNDDLPRVTHYNNQYDSIYSALAQFARSGDARWFRLADDMARHVADIDIYHTELDRAAFNGGLFWHTDHYTDAVTCTHRCYTSRSPQAQRGPYGGGPSAEHDYASGLATHFLMTGWDPSRDGALSLAKWVKTMDARDDTLVGWFFPGRSGFATRTEDHSYHGPGRGAGNSVLTLLDGLSLTGNEMYLHKTEELIRRCVHPDDDREAFDLDSNPEVRWSYTVMLLALVHYLEVKVERKELDAQYAYAQSTLVSYARWMLEHEDLSSKKKDRLEIWSSSWPAQDLRKGLVLFEAARHVANEEEQKRLRMRGKELLEAAQEELLEWDTRTLTRPLVLVMRYGYMSSFFLQNHEIDHLPIVPAGDVGRPSGFVPMKGKPKAILRSLKRLIADS